MWLASPSPAFQFEVVPRTNGTTPKYPRTLIIKWKHNYKLRWQILYSLIHSGEILATVSLLRTSEYITVVSEYVTVVSEYI